jgi:hypothetical protein
VPSDKGRPRISRQILDGILAVRDSGLTNMLDVNAVARIALDLGHPDAAAWVSDPANKGAYARGILRGFDVDGAGPRVEAGAEMTYAGGRHPYLRGYRVRVVRRIRAGLWECAPWIAEAGRFSWVTSDVLESELAPLPVGEGKP